VSALLFIGLELQGDAQVAQHKAEARAAKACGHLERLTLKKLEWLANQRWNVSSCILYFAT
jgi:hypothetical protein